MEPKSALSRIAATQPTAAAATAATPAPREALARVVRESTFPLERIFDAFAQAVGGPDPRAVPLDVHDALGARALAVAQRTAGVEAAQTLAPAYEAQLQEGLYELWRGTWRRGMTPQQTAEIARSVLADGATSMFEPHGTAAPGGPGNPSPPFLR